MLITQRIQFISKVNAQEDNHSLFLHLLIYFLFPFPHDNLLWFVFVTVRKHSDQRQLRRRKGLLAYIPRSWSTTEVQRGKNSSRNHEETLTALSFPGSCSARFSHCPAHLPRIVQLASPEAGPSLISEDTPSQTRPMPVLGRQFFQLSLPFLR